jgi:putative peptide zinc metalloprotease protein
MADAPSAAWLDSAQAQRRVVCEVRPGCCLQMSPTAYWLFQRMDEGLGPDKIAELISVTFGQRLPVAQIAKACEDVQAKIREQGDLVQAKSRRRYWFRIRLLSEPTVGRIARRLEPVLSRPMLAVYVGAVLAAVLSATLASPFRGIYLHLNSPSGLAITYLAYLLALCAHEMGHATASSRYGVPPGDIGFAFYLIFPAVYCDVTRTWLLPRRQRVVVDIGGLLFETALGAVYLIAGAFFHVWILTFAAVLILGNLIWVLNPFGRFDMYWALSDAFGVEDLRKESMLALRQLLPRSGRPPGQSGMLRFVLAVYGILMLLFVGWFGYNLAIMLPYIFSHLYPTGVLVFHAAGQGDMGKALRAGVDLLLPLAIFAMMYYRVMVMLWPAVQRLVARFVRPSRPAGEA